MPVNMDPAKKRRSDQTKLEQPGKQAAAESSPAVESRKFGEDTITDKEKDLADAEWKNLWDATEVIDMDKV